ncbi:carboxypeptidase SOL1 isoform X2 [Diospyros lotus]|uniref:carboxypeptidase SOL1 isoform X2 n=1 Tax=Diospyros lotus TaxID=55363 RepID=UPI00225A182D|nr:carboxypeptidase SOL1 isoform X2 [Diospyros lotus]
MRLILFLLVLSPQLSPLLRPASARGGERGGNSSGFTGHTYVGRRRLLLEENHLQKLDKLAQGYMSNSELEMEVKSFGQRCANISRIYSIGKSVMGVPLWVIEISDKPGEKEAEPAFKFIGNVHGDEPVGRELLLLLANWLCDNYMKDPLATLIIKNVHLHVLPSMNPDGFSLRRRGNANNIDLNRDFPDQFFPMNDDVDGRQPETKAIMNWLEEIRFTASASLHGGALVANYPWDGTHNQTRNYYGCPDDDTFRFLASIYSRSHHNMSLSEEFKGGITNGASWYPIYGGMQDWNYIYGGCFELTLEISDNKWPTADETGVHGRIFSSDCGGPLPAYIAIKEINYTIKASKEFADYHRLLVPGGRYEVVATMPGYRSKSTSILLGNEAAGAVDFILDPEVASVGNQLRCGCDCSCDNMSRHKLLLFWSGPQLELSFIGIFLLMFLCFLLKRRTIFSYFKHRQSIGPRRSSAA